MLGDQGLELGDERGVAAEGEVGVDAVLERVETQLLEPADLVLGEGLVGEVGQRRAAPEIERLSQTLGGAVGVAAIERLAALAGEALEAVGVDVVGRRPRARSRRRG